MAYNLLKGKKGIISGALNEESIAWKVALKAHEEGAEIVLTSFGRARRITERVAKRLPQPPEIIELDVTSEADLAALTDDLRRRWGRVDGALHSIGFAPEACLGGGFLDAGWDDVSVALQVSAYSLASLTRALTPLMTDGGSVVGLDFDNRQAWPAYDWMGVAKAALESTSRYLARDLGADGIRVNLVCAGPLRTVAARGVPGFDRFEDVWSQRAPLGWDLRDPEPVAKACVALLSDWFPATTGEMVHVDGGFHAIAAAG